MLKERTDIRIEQHVLLTDQQMIECRTNVFVSRQFGHELNIDGLHVLKKEIDGFAPMIAPMHDQMKREKFSRVQREFRAFVRLREEAATGPLIHVAGELLFRHEDHERWCNAVRWLRRIRCWTRLAADAAEQFLDLIHLRRQPRWYEDVEIIEIVTVLERQGISTPFARTSDASAVPLDSNGSSH